MVIALALVSVTIRFAQPLYQTVFTVLLAYVLMFLPRALVSLRAGLAQAPVELENIARSLGVTIQWFFASEVQVDPADAGYVVRRNARTSVHYEDGIVDELLSPQPSRQLEILHSKFPPGTYSQQSYSHDGEEAGYLLSG
ncbi:hypothetical protein M2C68_18520, partial [Pseudomonas sp. BAgro211]|nr:hypothetical protein [Pseudomonas sp. BAgro211]